MRYCVYPNPIRGTSGCLIVPEDTQLTDLPGNIQGRFGDAKLHRFIELRPTLKYSGLDVGEVLRSIAQKGYHIVGVPIPTMEQWPGQATDG